MEVEDMKDTLVKNQEMEIYQEAEKSRALGKSQERMKKKSQVQVIDLHMEALDQNLVGLMGLDQDLDDHMDPMDLEGPTDPMDLKENMDLMDLNDHMDLMDLKGHMGLMDLNDHMDHLECLNLKKEIIDLDQLKDLNLLIGQDHLKEQNQERDQGQL